MYRSFNTAVRFAIVVIFLGGMIFQPQSAAYADSSLTVTPITWNVVGLDSNNVNSGPNNFPVGVRACNPVGSTTSVNGVSAAFVWMSANGNINLRPGSLNPINSGMVFLGFFKQQVPECMQGGGHEQEQNCSGGHGSEFTIKEWGATTIL